MAFSVLGFLTILSFQNLLAVRDSLTYLDYIFVLFWKSLLSLLITDVTSRLCDFLRQPFQKRSSSLCSGGILHMFSLDHSAAGCIPIDPLGLPESRELSEFPCFSLMPSMVSSLTSSEAGDRKCLWGQ